jgi:hypothetical protein
MKLNRLLVGCAFVGVAGSSHACSVCIAHALGSAIHAIGSQTLPKGATIVGIAYTSFSKSQAGDTPGTSESHRQTQMDIDVMHGLSDSCMLRLSMPYVYKGLAATGTDTINTNGPGDISLGATFQVKPRANDKVLLAFAGDVKFATGANNLKDSLGARMDEHTQLGTGSTDFALGAVATSELAGGMAFAGLQYRMNSANSSGYRYGNVVFYNLGYSHRIDGKRSVVLELNGRFACKDKMEDGTLDDNSGGHFGYLSTSYRQSLGENIGIIGTYQIPIIRRLNGTQSESGLLTIGIFKKV